MSRVRINKNGIEIAKPGFHVETAALANMAFSSAAIAARVAQTGTVNVTSYSGFMSDTYFRGIVTFAAAFPNPPVVLVAGALSGGNSEQGALMASGTPINAGNAYVLPFYSIESYVDRFELYVLQNFPSGAAQGPGINTWRYWVLANTLQS